MPKRQFTFSSAWALVLVIGLLSAGNASAQQRRRNGARYYPVAPLRMVETGGELGFRYDYYSETQSTEGSDKVGLANEYFQEYLLGRTRGYIYHPRLIDFRAEAKIGLVQQIIRRSGFPGDEPGRETNGETINGYDVFVYFLKEHPVSFTAFANRDKSPVLELFTDRFLIERETRGGSVRWRNRNLPMQASFTRNLAREWGADSFSDSETDIFQYSARHRVSNWMRTELRYRYQEYTQHFRAENRLVDIERDTSLDSHNIDFTNTLYFTSDKRSHLTSSARYYKQRGTQDLETFNWQERLQLQHTRNLRSYYLAGYQHTVLPGAETDSYRGEAGIEHQLYKSIKSHLDVHGRRNDTEGLREDIVGATGRVNYRKRTALGVLTAGYSRTLDRYERTGGRGTRIVLDEPVVLQAGMVHYLESPDIDPDSIVVTDPQNQVTYVENFDYTVVRTGNRTGIEILPGGLLQDGDSVLVDYRFSVDTDFDYISDDQLFQARHDFEKIIPNLSVYYRWHDLSAHDLPDDRDLSVLSYTDETVGLKYRFWKRVEWTEEYREYDSPSSEYRQIRSQIEGNHRVTSSLRWGWNAGMITTEYEHRLPGDGMDSEFYFAGTRLTGPILRTGYWNIEGRGQKETGRAERTLLGALAKIGFKWRKIRFETGARYEHHEIFDSERDRSHVFVQVARLF